MPNWYGKNPAEPADSEPPDDILTQALEEHDASLGGPVTTRATYELTVEVAQQDEDLLPKVSDLVKNRFEGSAIRVIDVQLVDVRTLEG